MTPSATHNITITQKGVIVMMVLVLHVAILGFLLWTKIPETPISTKRTLSISFIDNTTPNSQSVSKPAPNTNTPKTKAKQPKPNSPKKTLSKPIPSKKPVQKTPESKPAVISTTRTARLNTPTPSQNTNQNNQQTAAPTPKSEQDFSNTTAKSPKMHESSQTNHAKDTTDKETVIQETTNKDKAAQSESGKGTSEQPTHTTGTNKGSSSTSEGNQNPSNNQAIEQNWAAKVRLKLERTLDYPDEALSKKWGGKATVRISVNAQGKVLTVSLLKSSGKQSLDEEALATVRRASPLPKPPSDLIQGQASYSFGVPITFDYKKHQ